LRAGRSGTIEDLRHIFQCDVWLGQPRNGLVFDTRYLAAPITRTPEDLEAYLARRPLDVLYWPGADRSVTSRVVDILRRELRTRSALPNATALAEAMRLPPHGLRRALAREGQTVQALMDQARFEAAREQLAHGRLSIDRIAESLGFDEPNSFRRAFKRWSGVSPQEFRRNRA
jgi:AraC-like DNA-binding protein